MKCKDYILNMEGNVYLIKSDADEYKIGCTKHSDVLKRLKSLQTGNPTQLTLVESFKSNKPYKLEMMLHNHFKQHHVINEWYSLTEDDVANFTALCEKFQNIINVLSDNPFFK